MKVPPFTIGTTSTKSQAEPFRIHTCKKISLFFHRKGNSWYVGHILLLYQIACNKTDDNQVASRSLQACIRMGECAWPVRPSCSDTWTICAVTALPVSSWEIAEDLPVHLLRIWCIDARRPTQFCRSLVFGTSSMHVYKVHPTNTYSVFPTARED